MILMYLSSSSILPCLRLYISFYISFSFLSAAIKRNSTVPHILSIFSLSPFSSTSLKNLIFPLIMDASPGSISNTQIISSDQEDQSDLRRGPWTVEEDLTLINYIHKHGEGHWNSLARLAGIYVYTTRIVVGIIHGF